MDYGLCVSRCVMELFNSQEVLDGNGIPRKRDQAREGWVKDIFVKFSSPEVPTDLLLEWQHKYFVQTKGCTKSCGRCTVFLPSYQRN